MQDQRRHRRSMDTLADRQRVKVLGIVDRQPRSQQGVGLDWDRIENGGNRLEISRQRPCHVFVDSVRYFGRRPHDLRDD